MKTTAAIAVLAAAGAHAAPQPAGATATQARPSYTFSAMTSVRYATPNPRTSPVTTYMPSASMSAILPSKLVTTTWKKGVDASDWNNPYGQAEWNRRWAPFMPNISISTFSISTTVAPTPIPSASLILPPDSGFQYGTLESNMTFPSDFIFGVSDSAGQIEGALQDEGRTPSVLDYLNFAPGSESNYVADWNYYLYKQDIARIAAMGVPYYYLTISWSRILPFGAKGTPVNKEGIDHYNDVINTCLEYGVKPIVAMVHADEPYEFVMGGGDVPDAYFSLNSGTANTTFVDSFVNYARILMGHYGDRVPIWITVNEPFYESGNLDGAYNMLEANAQIYHMYKDLGGKGMVSYKNADNFGVPLNPNNQSDVAAANRFQEYLLGIYSNPIFLGEDLPESVTSTLTNQSKKLTKEQLARYKGTADFYAIDPYSTTFVTQPPGGIDACANDPSNPLWPMCVVPTLIDDNNWEIGFYSASNVYYTPTYFRSFMNWMWDTYKPSGIMVSEFGYPAWDEAEAPLANQRQDLTRSLYYISYLTEVLNCIHKDGVNIIGALAWSALDDWEFSTYAQHFGLQAVNRTTMERTYKRSFFDFVGFFQAHGASA
ncbi:uncharacterized protein PFLUO_LOCUS5634 [Penicillium psychrofluorescens]|uniref:uncharacterized protein n=1 Tax=Penicillium psychrofluorescens TaxID=3158075 RepID=UPI003CCE1E6E